MGKLLDSLKEYFENNSKEVLEKDWEELKHFTEFNSDVLEYGN